MAKPISVSLGNNTFTVHTGDLTDNNIAQFASGALTLTSDVLNAAFGNPISSLSTDTLTAGLTAGTTLGWTLGPISLQFAPNVQGSITIRKAGEVFRFSESENDDDPDTRQIITVPAGSAYVSISLQVGIAVSAAGGFSNGPFGVKGSAQVSDTFLLANHVKVPAASTVAAALEEAFSGFVLPYRDNAYSDIQDGNFLEYQFYGKLNVALTATLGFGGVLFGGISGGDLKRSISSQIGTVAVQAKPEFNLSAAFSIGYEHEDAFRIVLSGLSDRSRLFLFKMDQSKLSAGLTLTAGVAANASVSLDSAVDDLIGKAAQRLFSAAPAGIRQNLISAFTARVKSNTDLVNEYVREAQDKINDQLAKLNKLKASAGIAFEHISEHATLLTIDFDRAVPSNGYKLAIGGDMAGAFQAPGTTLGPGSYIRSEIRKTTSLNFQLFETFSASSIQTYFEKAEIRYAGNGVFQLRFSTGVTASSNVFGHKKAIEIYFEATAASTGAGVLSDKDIDLRIKTTDDNNTKSALLTASMLHLVLRNTPFDGLDNMLRSALQSNSAITVNVSMILKSSAYARLRFSQFSGGHPPALQTEDAANYAAFVDAVDMIYAGGGFGTQGFPDQVDGYKNWAHYNITAIDQENASRPPNRRQTGNASTDSVWPQDPTNFPAINAASGVRPMLRIFMIVAQQFMNFCEDLPSLAKNLDQAATKAAFDQLLREAGTLVQKTGGTFPLFFTKPLAVAIVEQASAVVTSVQSPGTTDAASNTFNVEITLK